MLLYKIRSLSITKRGARKVGLLKGTGILPSLIIMLSKEEEKIESALSLIQRA
ncbi:hypothetical protein PR202_ga12997 [Eleusine coracana subsp. coracana]|uniref:Uncharacterized protein n=1 Tax=Eleusine coracana subsp. coracana TaxID=191504 RepID=A0AAV5CDN6_ELECO|nr:hypothetical protein PR202_ga12997 [Eleusine coracana subsp. coracana]